MGYRVCPSNLLLCCQTPTCLPLLSNPAPHPREWQLTETPDVAAVSVVRVSTMFWFPKFGALLGYHL